MNIDNLTPEQFRITQQCGTEAPFTGRFVNHNDNGNYTCICCDQLLFFPKPNLTLAPDGLAFMILLMPTV